MSTILSATLPIELGIESPIIREMGLVAQSRGMLMPAVVELSSALSVGAFAAEVQEALVASLLVDTPLRESEKELLDAAVCYLESAKEGTSYVTRRDFAALPTRPNETLQASSFCTQALQKLLKPNDRSECLFTLMDRIECAIKAASSGSLRDLAASDTDTVKKALDFFRTLSSLAMSATAQTERELGSPMSGRSGV